MELKNKFVALLGAAGAGGYAGHEYAHTALAGGIGGLTEIMSVSIGLGVFALAGIILNEVALHDQIPSTDSDVFKVALIGAASFSLFHDITHGTLGGGVLELGLSQTSYWLAGFSVVGVYLHELLRDY